jgi:hypothetical protein
MDGRDRIGAMRFSIFSVVDHYPAELPPAQFYGELLEQS